MWAIAAALWGVSYSVALLQRPAAQQTCGRKMVSKPLVRTVADQEEFRDASWRVVADVPRMCGSASQVGTTHVASHCLTSLAPQPPHRPAIECRFPWSERFDRIFRNEGVTGSNPVSSTKHPGQGNFDVGEPLLSRSFPSSLAPQVLHMMEPEAPHFLRGAFSPCLTSIRTPQCDASCRCRELDRTEG